MPGYQTTILRNPYAGTIPQHRFEELVKGCVARRADDVAARFADGEYGRAELAFIVLDPTLARHVAAEHAILFVALVGDADFFAPNALAKVAARRDHGVSDGQLVYSEAHRLPDGSFRFGYSVEVDGTQVGASGLTELQDRYQATVLAADLNYRIAAARTEWAKDFAGERWYANEQVAPDRFRDALAGVLGGVQR